MKNLKNKKGFTLVELLAVIVVLAIVMSLAVVSITGVVDDTRKKAFVDDAKSFLDGAHQLVTNSLSDIGGDVTAGYAPQCKGISGGGTGVSDTRYIPISTINLDRGGINSPYNNKYDKGELKAPVKPSTENAVPAKIQSYVKVTAYITDATTVSCEYHYYIYLTDGVYSIGTSSSPAAEIEYTGDADSVKVVSKELVKFDTDYTAVSGS